MKRDYEVIVLGLGGIGSGAAYWLSRRLGSEVLGLEQFELGHIRGGSQDHSRIIRLSYHTPGYVELAKEAYAAWEVLEADAEEQLILKTGGLDLFPANAEYPADNYTGSMDAAGVPYTRMDAAEVMARWPQFRLREDVTALYQAETGIAPAAKCNAAHQRMARSHGATLRDNAPVSGIRTMGDALEVTAGGESYLCRKLVIASGAWSNQLLAHFGLELPLKVTQEQVVYYDAADAAAFAPEHFPVWIWMGLPSFYGFPVYGENGPKVAQDVGGREVTADSRSFDPDPELQQRIDDFTRAVLPSAYGPPLLVKTCLYTLTPDRDFVVDTLPGHPNVVVAIGAGHAFKFASALGRILSELALDGETSSDITPFKIGRPILSETDPQTNYMI